MPAITSLRPVLPRTVNTSVDSNGLPALVMFLVGFFLWPISEGIWGRTIGKRLLNLKVVTDDFEPIGMGQEFGRFILGFLDYIFLIGLIIATTNKQNKRIGDIAAKTIVVNTKALESNLVKFQ